MHISYSKNIEFKILTLKTDLVSFFSQNGKERVFLLSQEKTASMNISLEKRQGKQMRGESRSSCYFGFFVPVQQKQIFSHIGLLAV